MRLAKFVFGFAALWGHVCIGADEPEPAYIPFEQVTQKINESQQAAEGHTLRLNGKRVMVHLPLQTFGFYFASKSAQQVWYYTEAGSDEYQLIGYDEIDLARCYHLLVVPSKDDVGRIRLLFDYRPVLTRLVNGQPVRGEGEAQVDFLYLASDAEAKSSLETNLRAAVALAGGQLESPATTPEPKPAAALPSVERIEILGQGRWDQREESFSAGNIPVVLGESFGFEYLAHGPVPGEQVELAIRFHPPGGKQADLVRTVAAKVGVPKVFLAKLTSQEDLIPGVCVGEIWFKEQKLAEAKFVIKSINVEPTPPVPPAKPFEGRMTATVTLKGGKPSTQQWSIKGARHRVDQVLPSGDSFTTVSDYGTGQLVNSMNGSRVGSVMAISSTRKTPASPKATGRVETIQGHRCEEYIEVTPSGTVEMWVTRELGAVLGNSPSVSVDGKYPLRIIERDAAKRPAFTMEVTSIVAQAVPDIAF